MATPSATIWIRRPPTVSSNSRSQAYYDRFRAHFRTTIDSTFFDEPTLYRAGGRTWTDKFNEKFRARHGFDPRPYYPALWHDIGPDTQAARNYLFAFRTELYATAFTKRIQDWCTAHGITATGHQDQEEVINPVSVSGDLQAWLDFAGWRVNYDQVLLALARLTMAPEALWSSARAHQEKIE